MDWARDHLGNSVHAEQVDPFNYGYGLTCPNCGQRVRRRAGPERRPHFAHYSYTANPECENYHPPLTDPVYKSLKNYTPPPHRPSHVGIYFARTERGTCSLFLKMPQLHEIPLGMAEFAKIEIHTNSGVRTYRALRLKRANFVPLAPKFPLFEVHADKELAALGFEVSRLIKEFRQNWNYFIGNDSGGRLLTSEEPLEWGEKYWLVTQTRLEPSHIAIGVGVEPEETHENWYSYKIALPPQPEDGSRKGIISKFLQREIKAPRARVFFVDPPPHHIQVDGTYIFPETTTRIVFRRTECRQITIKGHGLATTTELSSEWVEITGIEKGDFAIYLDGREELLGRLEECELFLPRGVHVTLGDSTWEIFDQELPMALRQNSKEVLRIECPNQRVANHLALPPEFWLREGVNYIFSGDRFAEVDAGNFGAFAHPSLERSEPEKTYFDSQTLNKRTWIEGILKRLYGSITMQNFPKQRGDLCLPCRSAELAWLQPYIMSTQSSKGGNTNGL